MASNSKAMLAHAGEPFFAWGDPLKLLRFYGTVDLRAKKCCPFVLKAQLKIRAVRRQAFSRKKKKEDEQFGTLADFQFGTSAMVPSSFEGRVGYRTLRDEGQAPLKAYGCVFGRVSQASVRIATYGMSVPSRHTESTDSVIHIQDGSC